jgi:hypothetical protein
MEEFNFTPKHPFTPPAAASEPSERVEPVTVGMKVKAEHPYTYRPEGCELATVTGIQVTLRYDNGFEDFSPLSDFWVQFQPASTGRP